MRYDSPEEFERAWKEWQRAWKLCEEALEMLKTTAYESEKANAKPVKVVRIYKVQQPLLGEVP